MSKIWYKNNKFYLSFVLTIIVVIQFIAWIVISFYFNPLYSKKVSALSAAQNEIEKSMDRSEEVKSIHKRIALYEKSISLIDIFRHNRERVFIFNDENEYDFYPPISDVVMNSIKNHVHNDIVLEGLSINEKADVVIPIYSKSYTTLAKQFFAFKDSFGNDDEINKPPLFKDIKLNTFLKQEKEIMSRDSRNRLKKNKTKVVRANIVAKLNPEYFINEDFNITDDLISDDVFKKKSNKFDIKSYFLDAINSLIKKINFPIPFIEIK